MNVVVVEDDLDILDLLGDLLASEGCTVLPLTSPNLNTIVGTCQRPDIFLIDLMLPGMNGIDLAVHLQRHFPQTPVIAMSASRLMLEVAGASGLFRETIAKPFNLSALLESVERCQHRPEVGDCSAAYSTS